MPIKLREALLCSYMLLNSKAWSDLKESQIDKMEVVKQSLLCSGGGPIQCVPLPRGGHSDVKAPDHDQEDDVPSSDPLKKYKETIKKVYMKKKKQKTANDICLDCCIN